MALNEKPPSKVQIVICVRLLSAALLNPAIFHPFLDTGAFLGGYQILDRMSDCFWREGFVIPSELIA
jgi:hypothetical protein